MHVLIIPVAIYPLPHWPLGGIFELHQAEALAAFGMQVGVLSGGVITMRNLGRPFPYQDHDLVHGIPVFRGHRRAYFPARLESPSVAAERSYRRLKPLLEQYMATYGVPDIIHAHNLAAGGLIAGRIHDDTGIPYVVTEHTSTYAADALAAQRDAEILAAGARDAAAVIAVGSHLAESLRRATEDRISAKIRVVPNVVEARLLSSPLPVRHGAFTVVGLGNLIVRKNYRLLLEAFSRAEIPPYSQLVIGGEGPESRRLGGLARSVGLGDRVRFPGFMDRDQTVGLMQQADLFAHPSNSESFGVVLIEALAQGVPVLATASYGPQDIVTSDVGRLTPIGDVQGFADGMSEMYARRDEFDRKRLREICRERFGPRAFASRMLEIYREAISTSPPGDARRDANED